MNELHAEGLVRPDDAAPIAGPLRSVLLESRQRWRDLVALAADLAYETDAAGRFTFVMPDPALGWSTAALVGRPAASLLVNPGSGACDLFAPPAPVRGQRVWLRRADGGSSCMLMAAAPLLDRTGRIIGARGIGTDITERDGRDAQLAAAMRRAEVIDHILWRMRQEVMAPRMMRAALEAMIKALGAEGAAVMSLRSGVPVLVHEAGEGVFDAMEAAGALLAEADPRGAALADSSGGRPLLVSACRTRFGDLAGITLWREKGGRAWDPDDRNVATSAASIIRMVLEHEAIQHEMASQARTDPLTGLLNRRAFMEELPRHIDRLERDQLPGTLMFADLDNFKLVNDRLGHEVGDQMLRAAADLLRATFRPTDLVARLGGDEFAVWLNGADHMTAAERAEQLRVEGPRRFAELADGVSGTGFSIGIAMREPGEETEDLIRRADLAMYAVKRSGRGHWRVSLKDTT